MSVYGRAHTHGVADKSDVSNAEDDDWETDPDYVNDVSEKEQRKGSKLIQPEQASVSSMDALRGDVISSHETALKDYQSKKVLYGGDRAAQNKKD